ncbi:hypothetical protein, partial [Streptomyces calidiresistens]
MTDHHRPALAPGERPAHEPADQTALAEAAALLDAGAPVPPHAGPLLAHLLRAHLTGTAPATVPPCRHAADIARTILTTTPAHTPDTDTGHPVHVTITTPMPIPVTALAHLTKAGQQLADAVDTGTLRFGEHLHQPTRHAMALTFTGRLNDDQLDDEDDPDNDEDGEPWTATDHTGTTATLHPS